MLFTMPTGDPAVRREHKPTPFPVVALYDPPAKIGSVLSARHMPHEVLLDSGATVHVTPCFNHLHDFSELTDDSSVAR